MHGFHLLFDNEKGDLHYAAAPGAHERNPTAALATAPIRIVLRLRLMIFTVGLQLSSKQLRGREFRMATTYQNTWSVRSTSTGSSLVFKNIALAQLGPSEALLAAKHPIVKKSIKPPSRCSSLPALFLNMNVFLAVLLWFFRFAKNQPPMQFAFHLPPWCAERHGPVVGQHG